MPTPTDSTTSYQVIPTGGKKPGFVDRLRHMIFGNSSTPPAATPAATATPQSPSPVPSTCTPLLKK